MSDSPVAHPAQRSIGAVLAGLVAIVVVSTATDLALHVGGVYPPPEQRMSDPLFALALGYRIAYGVAGCWLAARLAPSRPMAHALVLGSIGFLVSIAGAIAMGHMGPAWYSLGLVVTALPSAWLGGRLVRAPGAA